MLPDVIGYKLDKATNILKESGFNHLCVKLTAPPKERDKQPSSEYRVVKVTILEDHRIELVVCS